MAHFSGIKVLYNSGIASLPPRAEVEAALDALIEALGHGAVYHWTPASLLARKPIAR